MAKNKKTSWFKRGDEGWDQAKANEEAAKQRRASKGPIRFWLDNDQSAKLTFLDTPDFFIAEHNLKIGGKWFNYFTCRGDIGTCPLCEAGDRPSFNIVGSVINHKPYVDKEGNTHSNQKQLFVARGKAMEHLKKQIARREDLEFAVYELSRGSSNTECSTGKLSLAA
jgi:hypothetical protein